MSSLLPRVNTAATRTVGVLGDADRAALEALVARDPLVNVVVAARLNGPASLAPQRFGGTLLGVRDASGRLTAAAFHGGNLLPIGGESADWLAIGGYLRGRRRMCTSIVGRADTIGELWSVLEPVWGPARTVRASQPLLVVDDAATLPRGDARLRPARTVEFEDYLPAAAAMFTEELGVSPFRAAGGSEYRRRVARLVEQGRGLMIRDDGGRIAFKADIGAVSSETAQVQGVWTRPDLRGRGLGARAMAAVLRHALDLAPSASLYVNDFNVPARRLYARLGMRQAAVLSSVLF